MKKYFKNRLNLRPYAQIQFCFMLDIPLFLILKSKVGQPISEKFKNA